MVENGRNVAMEKGGGWWKEKRGRVKRLEGRSVGVVVEKCMTREERQVLQWRKVLSVAKWVICF